ncbi:hypothetical protein OIU77_003804 [Salix suchowensis]|uniref:Uncharacterized protein n=1 Tax=Salix suchowensis TaxID=1278906 RepID=A0ABQ9AS94_9ROSI|nr:hypothetical protein OIU77_003804 [Salix suchowensis]
MERKSDQLGSLPYRGKGLLKADFTEKALAVLKHSYQSSRVMRDDMLNRNLLSLYANVDGAEEVWEEWLSLKILFDIQLPNAMFTCYSQKMSERKGRGICEKDCREWELGAYSFDRLATKHSVGGPMVKPNTLSNLYVPSVA